MRRLFTICFSLLLVGCGDLSGAGSVADVTQGKGESTDASDGQSSDASDGTDVADGSDGTDAVSGADGVVATDGTDGADAVDGTEGTDGTDAVDGADAADATDATDGGTLWDTWVEESSAEAPETLNDVLVDPDSGSVWAVGDGGRIIQRTTGCIADVCDSEPEWTLWKLRTKARLRGVTLDPEGAVVAVGDNATIVRREGNAWAEIDTEDAGDLHAVWFSEPGAAYQGFAVGEGGTILMSSYAGDWWKMYSFTDQGELTQSLHDVDGGKDWMVFAVGDGGVVMKFNGKHWAQEASETTENLVSVSARDGEYWAISASGTLLKRGDDAIWSVTGTAPPAGVEVTGLEVDFGGFAYATTGAGDVLGLGPLEGTPWLVAGSTGGTRLNAIDSAAKWGAWAVGEGGLLIGYQ